MDDINSIENATAQPVSSGRSKLLADVREVFARCRESTLVNPKPADYTHVLIAVASIPGESFLKIANSVTEALGVKVPTGGYWSHIVGGVYNRERMYKLDNDLSPDGLISTLCLNPHIQEKYGLGDQ